jgi:hypothetical protein
MPTELTDKNVRAVITSIHGFTYYAVESPVYDGTRVLFTGYPAGGNPRGRGSCEIEYREVDEVRP